MIFLPRVLLLANLIIRQATEELSKKSVKICRGGAGTKTTGNVLRSDSDAERRDTPASDLGIPPYKTAGTERKRHGAAGNPKTMWGPGLGGRSRPTKRQKRQRDAP
jgi:hypothetical protein